MQIKAVVFDMDGVITDTEKLYRKIYEWVLEKRREGNTEFQYDLNPHRFNGQVEGIVKVMFSKTLRWLYGMVLFLILVVIMYYLWPNILEALCRCSN